MLNTLSDGVGVGALGVGVLLEFAGDGAAVHAGRHEVMVHVAQHADNLSGQGFIQNIDGLVYVAAITLGDGAFFNLAGGALADVFYVANEVWHGSLAGKE